MGNPVTQPSRFLFFKVQRLPLTGMTKAQWIDIFMTTMSCLGVKAPIDFVQDLAEELWRDYPDENPREVAEAQLLEFPPE
jgi:hypothetical protein